MKKLIVLAALVLVWACPIKAQQDRAARQMADRVAAAFFNGPRTLDRTNPVRKRVELSRQYWITDGDMPEFQLYSFKSFLAMDRWLKKEENEPGFPLRTAGDNVSCSRGLCRLRLVDGQMAHNHVYLTHLWYGRDKRGLYIKKMRILYG
jgi:hypothetical protein